MVKREIEKACLPLQMQIQRKVQRNNVIEHDMEDEPLITNQRKRMETLMRASCPLGFTSQRNRLKILER
eukprot:UN32344